MKRIESSEAVKGQTYFYNYNQQFHTCKVLGLRKYDKVVIEFTSGDWTGEKMTCKTNRLHKN